MVCSRPTLHFGDLTSFSVHFLANCNLTRFSHKFFFHNRKVLYFKRIEANHQRHHDDGCGDHDENRGDHDDDGDHDDLVLDQQPSIVFVPDAGVANNLLC